MPKVWLITGSSRGLGRALAEAVLTAGDKLVATARNPEQLADLVERFGDRVRAVALDVTNEPAAAHAVAVATEAFGRLDVLANNAGYGDINPIEDTSLDEFRAQIETNLFGVINVTKAALPLMREQRAGHILQFSSVGGRIGPVGRAPYAAAKWGVEGFSEVLSKEVGPLGVKVTIIEPVVSAPTSRALPRRFAKGVPSTMRPSARQPGSSATITASSPVIPPKLLLPFST